MMKVITTEFGQMLVDVNEAENVSTIVDAKTFTKLAQISSTEPKELLKAIRRVASLLRIKNNLEAQGVTIFQSFLQVKNTRMVKDTDEEVVAS